MARTQAQTDALNKMRAAKKVEPITDVDFDCEIEQKDFIDPEKFNEMFDFLPSGKRMLLAVFCGASTACATSYTVQIAAGYAVAGILTLTGSALLSFVIGILGTIIALLISIFIGMRVFGFVLSPKVSSSVVDAKNKIVGMFSKNPVVA